MAKLRVLLPFNGLIKKNLSNPFFRPYFAHFRPKIGHFFAFFSFLGPVFSERGVKKIFLPPIFFSIVFIYLSGLKKSYLETLYLFVEFLYLFLENPKNRFISLYYLKLKNSQKYPLRLLGENGVCTKSYQKPFISWRFGPIWTHLGSQKLARIFSPLAQI